MSELKVYHCNEWHNEYTEFYMKSEADKVLAYKDCEIKKLKDSLNKLLKAKTEQIIQEVIQKTLIYGDGFVPVEHAMKLVAEIRHQKYKRCLAMAERWLFAFYVTNKCNDKFYLRSLKYRELSKKFKEMKNAED